MPTKTTARRPAAKRRAAATPEAPTKAPRKVAVRKATAKRTDSAEGRVAPRKRAAASTATPATPSRRGTHERPKNPFGFVPDTDSSAIVDALILGGANRGEVNDKAIELVRKATGLDTRNGTEKNVPSLVSGVLRRLLMAGWEVEQTWSITPPKEIRKAFDERREELQKVAASDARRAKREEAQRASASGARRTKRAAGSTAK